MSTRKDEKPVATSTLRKLFEATQGNQAPLRMRLGNRWQQNVARWARTFEELLQAMNAMKKATEGKLDGEGK